MYDPKIEAQAREMLARLHESRGNKAGAFTVRQVGPVGTVFEAQYEALLFALSLPSVEIRPDTSQSERVSRLEEALKPFARIQDNPERPDSEALMVTRYIKPDEEEARKAEGREPLGEGARQIHSFDGIKLGDIRRARSALNQSDGGGNG